MKVKDLLEEIKNCQQEYGDDFLSWDIYTEQLDEDDKEVKRVGIQKNWPKLSDSEGWEYFKCLGTFTKFEKEKALTINVNY